MNNEIRELEKKSRVVIIGAGFAGLSAAKNLAKCNVEVIIIDRHNHHVFQPLLYQVATAALSPAQIAQPVRSILKKQANCTIAQGEVISIDIDNRTVYGHKGSVGYDYLIVATGATHTYFGNDQWSPFAPALKSIDDALQIRRRILSAFEKAEISDDCAEQSALMTFIIIGGGPTGVEMAGAVAELARHTLVDEFRRIKPAESRVILIEAGSRLLSSFPKNLSQRAKADLERIGVEVVIGQAVTDCTEKGVKTGENFIASRTIIWSAGVKASPAADWLKADHDKAGRAIVLPDLSLRGHSNIFVIGDTAHIVDCHGKTVPGLAPAATQQGKYVAQVINRRVNNLPSPAAFVYEDYGTMATIGRGKAVASIRNFSFGGFIAWVLWGTIHLIPLVGFRNRFAVAFDWIWAYFTRSRGVRLITSGASVNNDL